MATQAQIGGTAASLADAIGALACAEGTLGHVYAQGPDLVQGRYATRNLADVVHYLCLLHGRHPGVIDHASARTVHAAARDWMAAALDGFAAERSYITRLTVAAGPLPSTPGQAECEATVNGQRHALDMLAQSDRAGCAFGAAAALVLEWEAVRTVLDMAAKRFGIDPTRCTLPTRRGTIDTIAAVAESPAVERALAFGAHQLLGQHRGLWDLLEARQAARGEY